MSDQNIPAGTTEVRIPLEEIIAEVRREIGVRKAIYPSWVKSGRLKESVAQRRVLCMTAVLAMLQSVGKQ